MYILQWGAQSPSVKNDVPGTLYSVGICYYVLYPLPTVPSTQHHMLQMLMLTASQYMWVAAVNANNTAVRIAKASAKAQCLASVVRIGRRGWAAFVVAPAEADRRERGGRRGEMEMRDSRVKRGRWSWFNGHTVRMSTEAGLRLKKRNPVSVKWAERLQTERSQWQTGKYIRVVWFKYIENVLDPLGFWSI